MLSNFRFTSAFRIFKFLHVGLLRNDSISHQFDSSRLSSDFSSLQHVRNRRTCLGCNTLIECKVAAPPCSTRKLSLPDISAVVAVALLSSFFAALPNSFSTLSTNGPRLNLVLIVVWSLIMFTDTSPVLCRDASPYKVAFAFGLLLDLVYNSHSDFNLLDFNWFSFGFNLILN